MQASPCFEGMHPYGVFPIFVRIQNRGASVDGILEVKGSGFYGTSETLRYPISMPSGTLKQLTLYPQVNEYESEVVVTLQSPYRTRPVGVKITEHSPKNIGLIGDDAGGMAPLAKSPESENDPAQTAWNDCYASPETAPERAIGYFGLHTLVLTNGAERMNANQWSAIRHWVRGGGSLLLLGGANAAYLRLPETASLVPLKNPTRMALSSFRMWGMGTLTRFQNTSVVQGTLAPGAAVLERDGSRILFSAKPFGAGMVTLAAFNPLESPFRQHPSNGQVWRTLLRSTIPSATLFPVSEMSDDTEYDSSILPPSRERVVTGASKNPFQVQLPPLKSIGYGFVGYFLLVIPVTYFILKKMRRLQWGWFTAPLLSLFAAVGLYMFTADLYRAGMSRRTNGYLVMEAGDQEAHFTGISELFLPRAGTYPLQIPQAKAISSTRVVHNTERSGSSYRDREAIPLNAIDIGTPEVPHFAVGNLAFRRIFHIQSVPLSGSINATVSRSSDGNLTGKIQNGTPYTIQGGALRYQNTVVSLPEILPGQTVQTGAGKAKANRGTSLIDIKVGERQKSVAFLDATLSGESFGPNVGRYVGSPTAVGLLVSIPLKEGR
jgi:hypothetical protein